MSAESDGMRPHSPSVQEAYTARAVEYADLLGRMDAVADADKRLVEAWAQRTGGALAVLTGDVD